MANGTQIRSAYYDNIKSLLIFSVVIGHFIDCCSGRSEACRQLFLFIYSFHMPLFIFVSGLFYNKKKLKQRTISYLMLFIMIKVVFCIENIILARSYSFSLTSGNGMEWFVLAIAAMGILVYILDSIKPCLVLGIGIMLGCFVGFDKTIGDQFAISRIIVFFPFYYVATMLDRDYIEKKTNQKWFKIIALVVLIVWAGLCIFKIDDLYILRHLFTGRNAFDDSILSKGPLYRLLCYLITTIVGLSIMTIAPHSHIPVVTFIGKKTMQIYFWHFEVLKILVYYEIHNHLWDWNNRLGLIVWGIIAIALTIVQATSLFSFPSAYILDASSTRHREK